MGSRWHERYQRALRHGLSFDDAALIADGLTRGIGVSCEWEPDCALLCCWGGCLAGDAEAARWSGSTGLGPMICRSLPGGVDAA